MTLRESLGWTNGPLTYKQLGLLMVQLMVLGFIIIFSWNNLGSYHTKLKGAENAQSLDTAYGIYSPYFYHEIEPLDLPAKLTIGVAQTTFTKAANNVITTQKTALTTIQNRHDDGHQHGRCSNAMVPRYCSQAECNLAKKHIQQGISAEDQRCREYIGDSYNKAKVDALYAASKDTDRTILEELERLNEKAPRDTLHDEL